MYNMITINRIKLDYSIHVQVAHLIYNMTSQIIALVVYCPHPVVPLYAHWHLLNVYLMCCLFLQLHSFHEVVFKSPTELFDDAWMKWSNQ